MTASNTTQIASSICPRRLSMATTLCARNQPERAPHAVMTVEESYLAIACSLTRRSP